MRFLLVDRIIELAEGKRASGIKNISWDEDFFEEIFPGIPVFFSIVLAEAAAQLISWLITATSNFKVMPLVTMLDSYRCSGHVQPGAQIEMKAYIENLHPESALVHGEILFKEKQIIDLNHIVCSLNPLNELINPDNAKRHFMHIYTDTESHPPTHFPPLTNHGSREGIPVKKRIWVDRILNYEESGRIVGVKNVSSTEDCFNDHFPLKPILPGVFILESMVSLSRTLVERTLIKNGLNVKKPILKSMQKIKFRRFVQPGDQLVMDSILENYDLYKSRVKAKAFVGDKIVANLSIEFVHLEREHYLKAYLI